MRQSIVEVIVYLLHTASTQTDDEANSLSDQVIITRELEDVGFSREVIAHTFDWLRELIDQQRWYAATKVDDNVKANKTMRVFDPEEKARINPAVRSFILSLEYSDILDTKMREIVINQLMQLNHRLIELTDAKWVVLLVLMSKLNKNIQNIRGYFLATVTLGV